MENKDNPVSDFERLASNVEEVNNNSANEVKPVQDNQNINETPKQEDVKVSDDIIIEEDNATSVQESTDNNPSVQNDAEKSTNVTASETNNAGIQNKQINIPSQSIGTIKPDKQKSPIAMIVLFSALIVFILFMPQIIELSNKYLGTNLNANNGEVINEFKPSVDKPDDSQEIKIYPLNDETAITLDTISFTDFEKNGEENNYTLSFNIKNNSVNAYIFEKKVYLDYLDNNNTLVGRSYIETLKSVSSNATNSYKIDISNEIYQNASNVELVLRTDDDYPNVDLSMNQLTCDKIRNNEKDTLIYSFTNSRLDSIKDIYDYTKTSDIKDYDYNSKLLDYKEKMSNLNTMEGVTGVVTESSNGFMASISIDYQNADYTKLSSNTNYYVKETYAKIVAFEMGAKNYNCR